MSAAAPALVFPGQGSQVPGMGRALIEAGHQFSLLEIAEEQGIPLRRLLVEGDAEALRSTQVAQPALYYTGVALARLLLEGGVEPASAAGHSLGEYCAVVAAGSMAAEDGMRLVLERGRLMASAPEGTMAAVLGLELGVLEQLCRQASEGGECCVVANDNSPGQLVVSGSRLGVGRLAELAKAAGARRVAPLKVGGAFHSPLMAGPARAFSKRVDQLSLDEPSFPVAAGVTGQLSSSSAEIRSGLRRQLEGSVRWTDAVRAIGQTGVGTFVECGPGSTLAGLIRRILPDAQTISVDSPESAERLLADAAAGDGPVALARRA